jgi:hypothetical protein
VAQFELMMQLYQNSSTRSFGPNSQALPIHAKTGREWGPENPCSSTDPRMTNYVVGTIDFKMTHYPNCQL